ncbi:MAG: alkaline phosphatase family protein [Lachnospiraceae bacterium]|nr:alkaline phosphatase family protein [Lachnospiraceae bacterium]
MNIKETLRSGGPDYDKCLVNLSNSILKSFGAETSAATLPSADAYLSGNHKNVVLLLLDALGISILEKHLSEDGFFRSHLKDTYYSVYPPTTVAATTSVLSALYPNEHGWLGWDVYFPELDKNVTVFRNLEQQKEKKDAAPTVLNKEHCWEWGSDSLEEAASAADFHAGFTYTPYKNIIDRINEAGGRAYFSMPFMPPYPDDLEKILARVKELCEEDGRKFIYAYWNEPDSTMHRTGTMSPESRELVRSLEERIRSFASELSDTLLIITADHSHMDSRNLCILDHPEVMDCLVRMPSIEPRTLNLFVKDEHIETFPEIFRKAFGEDFLLLKREEVLKEKLFGPGEDRPGLSEMIGDYVALSTGSTSVFNTHYEAQMMPGGHAGLTAEENLIPLIVVEIL